MESRPGIKLAAARYGDTKDAHASINLDFSGQTGAWHAGGRAMKFEVRDVQTSSSLGQPLGLIHRVEFPTDIPGRIVLRLNGGRQPLQIYYAPWADACANVVDDNGMALPAFGPVRVN